MSCRLLSQLAVMKSYKYMTAAKNDVVAAGEGRGNGVRKLLKVKIISSMIVFVT